jgi:hypothetical protein
MRGPAAMTLALLVAVARPSPAAEFIPGWDTDIVWDSNVFRTPEGGEVLRTGRGIERVGDQEADFSIRTGPDVRVRERQGDLQYDLLYQLRFEEFVRLNDIREFDHFAVAEGDWQITRNTSVSLRDDFAYAASLGSVFDLIGTGPDQVAIASPERQRITTNAASAGLLHRIGPLWELSADLDSNLVRFSEEGQVDSTSLSGSLQLTRSLSPRLAVGGGTSVQRQEFEDNGGEGDSQGTTFYQGFGVVRYSFSPTFRINASGGPAWSVPDDTDFLVLVPSYQPVNCSPFPTNCPRSQYRLGALDSAGNLVVTGPAVRPVIPGELFAPPLANVEFPAATVESELSYFGRISLEKEWRLWLARLEFSRNASSTSGTGTSTVLTSLSGDVTWTPSRDWNVRFSGTYSLQTAANQVNGGAELVPDSSIVPPIVVTLSDGTRQILIPDPVSRWVPSDNVDPVETTSYRFELRAERRFGRNLSVDGSASYWHQESNSTASALSGGGIRGDDEITDIWRVVLGITWKFDPIPL